MRLLSVVVIFLFISFIGLSFATPYDVFAITEISAGNTCGSVQEYRLTKMNVCLKNNNEYRINYSNGTYIKHYSCPISGCKDLTKCTTLMDYPIGKCAPFGKSSSLSAYTKFPHYSISIHPFIQTFSLIGNSDESCSKEPHTYVARKHQQCLITEDVLLPDSFCKSSECLEVQKKKSGKFVCGNQIYFFQGYETLNCTGPMKIFNVTESGCKNSTEGYSRILQCSNSSKLSFLFSNIILSLFLILIFQFL